MALTAAHSFYSLSGFQHAWKFSPLLVHASPLDPQEQGEEVLIIHGSRSPAALVLQPTLCLWVAGGWESDKPKRMAYIITNISK